MKKLTRIWWTRITRHNCGKTITMLGLRYHELLEKIKEHKEKIIDDC